MQITLAEFMRGTPDADEAASILRKCVHCGFCTATCPTYQLLGDELDGPRGRIYLIKQLLEGGPATLRTRLHLDRCLSCRACETTCPSGVQYGRLADIGRKVLEARVRRGLLDRFVRAVLAFGLPRTRLFTALLRLGQALRPFLPGRLKSQVPGRAAPTGAWPAPRHARRMLVLAGCVQPALAPRINAAAARVLDRMGISLIEAPGAGCCGAVRFHLDDQAAGLDDARRLIDAWGPLVDGPGGVEAIVMSASGCGAMVREFGHLLRHDALYRDAAARVSALTRDLSEIVAAAPPVPGAPPGTGMRVAFHAPCTLQHGQQIRGVVEGVLTRAGCELAPVADAHLCCGSAGTYSILQPALARELRTRKLGTLQAGLPAEIVTANIGCLTHLAAGTATPVRHWIELLDALQASAATGARAKIR